MGDKEQLVLFEEDVEESLLVDSEKRGGIHTAADFEKKKPLESELIQRWLLQGLSQREIARELHCSRNIVSRFAEKMMNMDLDEMKTLAGNKLRNLALVGTEELLRRVQHCPELMASKDLSVMVGVATQNSQLLTGHATQIHQWDRREELKPAEEDYERLLLEEKKKAAVEGDFTDVTVKEA